MRKASICVLLLIVISTSAFAKCEDVYKAATRTYTSNESDWSSLKAIYENQCTATGSKNDFSMGGTADVIAEGIPLSLTGNARASQEKISNFCRNFQSRRFDSSYVKVMADTVVVQALKNFNECKAIESKGQVLVSHRVGGLDSVVIDFAFHDTTSVLEVQGVVPTNLSCRAVAVSTGTRELSETSMFEITSVRLI